jgi:putative Holliday junction resolvase
MRILGIDYGTKRVGLAISDVEEKIAFPLGVMPNSPSLVRELILLIAEKEIGRIVIGESLKGDGRENALMEESTHICKKIN